MSRSITLFTLFICLFIGVGCHLASGKTTDETDSLTNLDASSTSTIASETTSTPEPKIVAPEPYTQTAQLIAVGDIMMHEPQILNAYDASTKTYNMNNYFTEVREILMKGDWVVANLETTLAGADSNGYSGYPMFNSPTELADALTYAGFQIVTTANNHSLDRREAGVLRTIKHLREKSLAFTGTASSAEEAKSKLIVSHQDIAMGFLSYTYGTNGIPIPENKDYLVNLIDEEKIKADIEETRQQGADLVAVSLHFGNEYQRMPSEQQIALSTALVQAGADIILGSHPHVVQPIQWVEYEREDGSTKRGLIVYSMGNFISSQVRDYKDVGMIVHIGVSKSFPDGNAQVDSFDVVPTYVHREVKQGKSQLQVLPLDDAIQRYAGATMNAQKVELLQRYRDEIQQHVRKIADMRVPLK
jgi:poly-gamma-glutamate capsule biosynthesis protein CapA/YwtB (metallophosphatase superfamily)